MKTYVEIDTVTGAICGQLQTAKLPVAKAGRAFVEVADGFAVNDYVAYVNGVWVPRTIIRTIETVAFVERFTIAELALMEEGMVKGYTVLASWKLVLMRSTVDLDAPAVVALLELLRPYLGADPSARIRQIRGL